MPPEEDHRDFMDAMSYIARCFKVPDSILKKSDSEEIKKQEIISKENVEQIKEEASSTIKTCATCVYVDVPVSEEPCRSCMAGFRDSYIEKKEVIKDET